MNSKNIIGTKSSKNPGLQSSFKINNKWSCVTYGNQLLIVEKMTRRKTRTTARTFIICLQSFKVYTVFESLGILSSSITTSIIVASSLTFLTEVSTIFRWLSLFLLSWRKHFLCLYESIGNLLWYFIFDDLIVKTVYLELMMYYILWLTKKVSDNHGTIVKFFYYFGLTVGTLTRAPDCMTNNMRTSRERSDSCK